ncbi:MAG: fumarylacetoacetate hydrolase family protein [Candidatus Latescibacteria bacterium]|jgi:2-keto-4-pentenoate hydratase/2-oxohepta-3-ene-1,7-dioic acid hydratase in catechol pathway|nr:fumarylacetoacetate hydrolase family protein [Candidatus Latescibacterota bacterium]
MRIVSFKHDGERRLGVRSGDLVIDLNRADPEIPADLKAFLSGGPGMVSRATRAVESGQAAISASDVQVLAPISDPDKIICIGLNYADHAVETKMEVPTEPVVFAKYATALIGPGDGIRIPPSSAKVDYEAELVAVIGKAGRDIAEADALGYVAGYTVGHDVSARDYQLEKPAGQWLLGKTFDTFAPIGPDFVTADEIPDPHALGVRCVLNGQTVQESCTDQLIFRIDRLISYLSHVFTFTPGDLLFTGTPPGVGMARTPPLWLKSGDTVVCEVDGIGRLENPVV